MNDNTTSKLTKNKQELLKEFNSNYKNYLQNMLIYKACFDLLTNERTNKTSKLDGNQEKTQQHHDQEYLEYKQKCQNRFWKTHILLSMDNQKSSSSDQISESTNLLQNNTLINDLKPDELNDSNKERLINEIELYYESYLRQIDSLLQAESTAKSDGFEQILSHVRGLTEKIGQVNRQINDCNDDISLKLESYFNLSNEIINLLIKILSEFKLKHNLNKTIIDCESTTLKCDMLFEKIETIIGECLHETYSNDNIKVHKLIKQTIDLNFKKYKDKSEHMKSSLLMYKNLGSEFERLHKSYIELKTKLDNAKWTLDKLNNEQFY